MVDIVGYDAEKKKKVTCRQCTAMLSYSLTEVQSRVDSDYGGGSETVHFINCPGCGNVIEVKGY